MAGVRSATYIATHAHTHQPPKGTHITWTFLVKEGKVENSQLMNLTYGFVIYYKISRLYVCLPLGEEHKNLDLYTHPPIALESLVSGWHESPFLCSHRHLLAIILTLLSVKLDHGFCI